MINSIGVNAASEKLEQQEAHINKFKNTRIAALSLIAISILAGVGTYYGVGHIASFALYASEGLTGLALVSGVSTGIGSIYHKNLARNIDEELSEEELLKLIDQSPPKEITQFIRNTSPKIREKILQAMMHNKSYSRLDPDSEKVKTPTEQQQALFEALANFPIEVANNVLYLNRAVIVLIGSKMNKLKRDDLVKNTKYTLDKSANQNNLFEYQNKNPHQFKERITKILQLFTPFNDNDLTSSIRENLNRLPTIQFKEDIDDIFVDDDKFNNNQNQHKIKKSAMLLIIRKINKQLESNNYDLKFLN